MSRNRTALDKPLSELTPDDAFAFFTSDEGVTELLQDTLDSIIAIVGPTEALSPEEKAYREEKERTCFFHLNRWLH